MTLSASMRPIVSIIAIRQTSYVLMPNGFFPPLVEIDVIASSPSPRIPLTLSSIFAIAGPSDVDHRSAISLCSNKPSRATGETPKVSPRPVCCLSTPRPSSRANTHSVDSSLSDDSISALHPPTFAMPLIFSRLRNVRRSAFT